MQRSWSLRTSGSRVALSNDWQSIFFFTHHLDFSHHALGKVMTQMFCTFRPRDKNQNTREEKSRMTSEYVFKSDTCTLKIPTLMLGESLWGASTCKSRWETHLYFLKTRKGMERGRSIADRTCLLNVTVRWLNRPLWGYYNSRLHTVPALTGSAHATHSTPCAVP